MMNGSAMHAAHKAHKIVPHLCSKVFLKDVQARTVKSVVIKDA
jgi:hypothetical protein